MLSEETKKLMAGEESVEIDFKQQITSDLDKDVVSFANSEMGGIILIGVEEYEDRLKRQRGRLHQGKGILLSDENKMKIENTIASCKDNIRAEVIPEEKKNGYGLFKIKIQRRGKNLYCTGGGRYLIRRNARRAPVSPALVREIILGSRSASLEVFFYTMLDEWKDELVIYPRWKKRTIKDKNGKISSQYVPIWLGEIEKVHHAPISFLDTETDDILGVSMSVSSGVSNLLPTIQFAVKNIGNLTAKDVRVFIAFPEDFRLYQRYIGGEKLLEIETPFSFTVNKLNPGLGSAPEAANVEPPKEKSKMVYTLHYLATAENTRNEGDLTLHVEPKFEN